MAATKRQMALCRDFPVLYDYISEAFCAIASYFCCKADSRRLIE